MKTYRTTLTFLVAAFAAFELAGCAGGSSSTGTAGTSGGGTTGAAGTGAAGTGAAGTGAAGTGVAGTVGTAGTTGAAGSAGTTGIAGTSGAAGTNGTAGTTGAGRGGTTGTAGSSGTTGTAGRGGTTGTAGSGGRGGATGTAGSGGSVAGCPAGAVFCDDFESGTNGQAPNAPKWTLAINGGGTVQVDGTVSHNGSKSLHVNGTNGFSTMAMVQGAPVFPLPGGVLYGRAFLRLKTLPSNHVIWIEAGSIANDVAETRIGANMSGASDAMDINRWPGDTEQRAPSARPAAATWFCVEFMFDTVADEARVWLDSTELTDLHVTNWVAPVQANGNNTTPILNWAPDYQAVRFGWELGGSEIWYDDIALGYSRIGCL